MREKNPLKLILEEYIYNDDGVKKEEVDHALSAIIGEIRKVVPEEAQVYCNSYRPGVDLPEVSHEYFLGYNQYRTELLAILDQLGKEEGKK